MSNPVISVENLSKQYRLGSIGGRTFRQDAARWWARRRGRPDPYLRLGQTDYANQEGETIWALRDINLQVSEGEIVGIIGRNGAGKSTLLKILSRITAPTAGQVKIKGRIGSLLEVGTGFHPELTGRENVYLNGAILGMTRAEVDRKFDEIVDFSGVEQYIDTPVKRYSSGMQVRLAFAVAAHLEPEILVVDEVLAVGDAGFQRKCIGKIGDVAAQGRTVLFVSHNIAMVENLCPRAVLLQGGRKAIDDATERVIESYLETLTTSRSTDLSERVDRNGTQRTKFTRVQFLNQRLEPVQHVGSGERIIIRLHYESSAPIDLTRTRISIGVERVGHNFFVLDTSVSGVEGIVLQPTGTMDCEIEDLPLGPGEYHLTLFMETNSEVQDWIENAAEMRVVEGDFFGTGRTAPTGWEGKSVLVRHNWRIAMPKTEHSAQ